MELNSLNSSLRQQFLDFVYLDDVSHQNRFDARRKCASDLPCQIRGDEIRAVMPLADEKTDRARAKLSGQQRVFQSSYTARS